MGSSTVVGMEDIGHLAMTMPVECSMKDRKDKNRKKERKKEKEKKKKNPNQGGKEERKEGGKKAGKQSAKCLPFCFLVFEVAVFEMAVWSFILGGQPSPSVMLFADDALLDE